MGLRLAKETSHPGIPLYYSQVQFYFLSCLGKTFTVVTGSLEANETIMHRGRGKHLNHEEFY